MRINHFFKNFPLFTDGSRRTGLLVSFVIFGQGLSILKGAFWEMIDASASDAVLLSLSRPLNRLVEDPRFSTCLLHVHGLRARRAGSQLFVDFSAGVPGNVTALQLDRLKKEMVGALKAERKDVKEVHVRFEVVSEATEQQRKLPFGGTANGMGSATKPCLPTEESKDLRTAEEKAELLAWVRPRPISFPSVFFSLLRNHANVPSPQAARRVARNQLERQRRRHPEHELLSPDVSHDATAHVHGDTSNMPASPVSPPMAVSSLIYHAQCLCLHRSRFARAPSSPSSGSNRHRPTSLPSPVAYCK